MQPTQLQKSNIRHNLPIVQPPFIGCEAAIAAIKTLLNSTRLLTITGSGGSGKTRLALRVAEEVLEAYPDGVCWVDLAAISADSSANNSANSSAANLVPQVVADALRLREQPQQSFTELLIAHLHDHTMLLVLDNCEHLRAACAELLTMLFHAGTLVSVLATSREPLGVAGEKVYLAPMLSVPSASTTISTVESMQFEAVRLFDERARAVAPTFKVNEQNVEAVLQICRQLDGMPLAIELAAARVNVLAPRQIVERLSDSMRLLTRATRASASRHQTLRAALEWSFNLLSAQEQAFFRRLAVFTGNFGLDAVESICVGQGLEQDEVLDLLANLVEKSLVVAVEQNEEMRYRLLVPIRHYAAELLRAATEEELWSERHAAWYLALAQRADIELKGSNQVAWLDRLEGEHDNLRAALAWYASAPGRVETRGETRIENGLQLSGALSNFWSMRGYISEGYRWLQTFLQRVKPATSLQSQAEALNGLGRISIKQSNFLAAQDYLERALAVARQAEYDSGVEDALIGLGVTFWELGEFQMARAKLDEAILYIRTVQHLPALARALNNLSLVCMHQGDSKAARACLDECLAINQQLGNKTGIAVALYNLAMMAGQSGDYVRAQLLYQEALGIDKELGNRSTVADVLNNLGSNAISLGDFATATAYLDEAGRLYREVGNTGDSAYVTTNLGDIAFYEERYREAQAHYQEALALFREANNRRLISRILGQLGRIASHEGHPVAAATLCAEAITLRRAIGHKAGMIFELDQGYVELALAIDQPAVAARILGAVERTRQEFARPRTPVESRQQEPITTLIRKQLGDPAFTAAWAEGAAMSLEDATAYVLDTLSPATVGTTVGAPRPELRVFALGPARIYRGDRLLTSADWTYAKARELIFYLLHRPNATREQIGLEFWPDASAEQVRKRLSAALAHARNALGREQEWITLTDSHYRIDPARAYWFDVEIFEARLQAAKRLLQNGGARQQAIPLLDDAISLYQGDFAEEFLEGEWHQPRREALRQAYLEALLTVGELQAECERYDQAIVTYQRALAKDPYLEEAHHELIRCYARLNKRSLALRQYDSLKTALAELGATPSPETQALIERLRRGEPL